MGRSGCYTNLGSRATKPLSPQGGRGIVHIYIMPRCQASSKANLFANIPLSKADDPGWTQSSTEHPVRTRLGLEPGEKIDIKEPLP